MIANPPELLRIGAAYAAKTVCSNVFVVGRDGARVLAQDVQAPGHPILKHLEVRIDQERKVVRTLTIYGTEGTLRVPDPNTFGGPVKHLAARSKEWTEIEVTKPNTENSRGLGAADLGASAPERPGSAAGMLSRPKTRSTSS